jgi:hypothetical protein
MGISLCAITNVSQTESISEILAEKILTQLKTVKLDHAQNVDGSYDTEGWSYILPDHLEIPVIEFNSGFNFSPCVYQHSIEIGCIARYSLVYWNYKHNSFQKFREELYSIVKVLGGTEVIYCPDSILQLSFCLDEILEGGSYHDFKNNLILKFGNPVTDFAKLDYDQFCEKEIAEFFLDTFDDLK